MLFFVSSSSKKLEKEPGQKPRGKEFKEKKRKIKFAQLEIKADYAFYSGKGNCSSHGTHIERHVINSQISSRVCENSASWRSTSAELNRSPWVLAFYCFVFDATMKARFLKREHNLRSRLCDLFCFFLHKENNLQILAFFYEKMTRFKI